MADTTTSLFAKIRAGVTELATELDVAKTATQNAAEGLVMVQAKLDELETEIAKPHPCGDPCSDLPPTGGPELRATPETFASVLAGAPPKARIIMTGEYRGFSLNNAIKAGQRLEADGDVTWHGDGSKGYAIRTSVPDGSIIGLRFTGYHLNPTENYLNDKGRMKVEDAVIRLERETAINWAFRDVSIENCRSEAVRLASGFDWRGGLVHNCNSVGIAGFGHGIRLSDIDFHNINSMKAASHHHAAAIKILGGRAFAPLDRFPDRLYPPTRDVEVARCRGFNLISCRGLVWFDWDCSECVIEDFGVDGCDKEAVVIEASAKFTIRRGMIKDANRVAHLSGTARHPIWNTCLMLQNTKDSRVEQVDIYCANACQAAIGIAHHWRRRDRPVGEIGANAGHTIGAFTSTGNIMDDCGFGGLIVPQLVVDAHTDYPPTGAISTNLVTHPRSL